MDHIVQAQKKQWFMHCFMIKDWGITSLESMHVFGKYFRVHAKFSGVIGVQGPILACTTYQTRRIRRADLTYLSSRRTRDGHIFFRSCQKSPYIDIRVSLYCNTCHLNRRRELVFSFYLCAPPWGVNQRLKCFVMKNSLPPLFFPSHNRPEGRTLSAILEPF